MNSNLNPLPVPATRLLAALLLLLPLLARGQLPNELIHKIYIQHIGPPAVSDAFVRANIRSKEGERLFHATIEEDERSLYGTRFFHNVHIYQTNTPDGYDLTYMVQGEPIVTSITITGNKKLSLKKLEKKLTSKVGQPLDERKLFSDKQEILKLYQKSGRQKTKVEYVPVIDKPLGKGTITFEGQSIIRTAPNDIVRLGIAQSVSC